MGVPMPEGGMPPMGGMPENLQEAMGSMNPGKTTKFDRIGLLRIKWYYYQFTCSVNKTTSDFTKNTT